MHFRVEIDSSISSSRGRRHELVEGQLMPLSNGWVLVSTPLVSMVFDGEGAWPFTRVEGLAPFGSAVRFLDGIAKPEISELEIRSIALILHERLVYAKTWRKSRGLLRNSKSSPIQEIKKLRMIAAKASWEEYFEAFRKSSFFVKDLLADICGDFIYPESAALSPEVLIAAADKALADPRLRTRPRELELDRCASTLISVYERFTGKSISLVNDRITHMPTSGLHQFVRDYGLIYGVEIVTDASDGRLDKMLKRRTEFGFGEILALG
jgi:hypothetical protein